MFFSKCSSLGRRAEVLCEENRCLIENDIIDGLNYESQDLGWQSGNHSEFWGKTLDDGIQLRLGTLNPSKSVNNKLNINVKIFRAIQM